MNGRGVGGNIGGVNVRTLRLQITVKRKGDMQRVQHVQGDIAKQAAVSRMPVRIVPGNLIGGNLVHVLRNARVHARGNLGELRIGGGPFRARTGQRVFHEPVVAHDGQHIGSIPMQPGGEIKTEGNKTAFAHAQIMTVEIHLRHLPRGLKFNINFFTRGVGRQRKRFAIPRPPAPLVLFATMAGQGKMIERIRVVISVREGNVGPRVVVKIRRRRICGIGLDEFPARIKVKRQLIRADLAGLCQPHQNQTPKTRLQATKEQAFPVWRHCPYHRPNPGPLATERLFYSNQPANPPHGTAGTGLSCRLRSRNSSSPVIWVAAT